LDLIGPVEIGKVELEWALGKFAFDNARDVKVVYSARQYIFSSST